MRKNFSTLGKRLTAYMLMTIMGISMLSVPAKVKADELQTDAEQNDMLEIQSEELSSYAIAKGELINKFSRGFGDSSTVKDRDWQKYRSTYVFDQMNAEEKRLYNAFESVCMDYIKNSSKNALDMGSYGYYLPAVSIEEFDDDSYADVLQLFVYSNPQYYFTTSAYATDSDKTKLYMYCYPSFADGDDRAEVTNSLFSTVDEWVCEISEEKVGSRDIEKAAHDFLCEKVTYDNDAEAIMSSEDDYSEEVYQTQSIYSTLIKGKTVCAGYSLTYELLLNAAGVPAVTTYSAGHAWNKVYIDDCNRWYAVDVTWDDDDNNSNIGYWFYNKSDKNIKKYDAGSSSHDIKLPKYYPVSDKDFEDSDVISYVTKENDEQDIDETDTTTDTEGDNDEYIATPAEDDTEEIEVEKEEEEEISIPESMKEQKQEVVQENAQDSVKEESYQSSIDTNSAANVADTTEEVETDDVDADDDEEDLTIDTPKLSKAKASGSKKCKITWKKVSDVSGYEIQLSTTKKFKKIYKKVKVSKNSTSVTIKKLKKSTYYVRIRAYSNVDGEVLTSDWSGVKKVTIK